MMSPCSKGGNFANAVYTCKKSQLATSRFSTAESKGASLGVGGGSMQAAAPLRSSFGEVAHVGCPPPVESSVAAAAPQARGHHVGGMWKQLIGPLRSRLLLCIHQLLLGRRAAKLS